MVLRPLIVVVGSTGTGKTNLAVELCKRFNGEIINMDSMQIYKGLAISTNKATDDELQGVPQHMHSFVDPSVTNYNVRHFRNATLSLLEDMWERKTLPVLVGGTAYYLEAVVWDHLLPESDLGNGYTASTSHDNGIPSELQSMSTRELYDYLGDLDSAATQQLHPDNRRRLMHAIRIHLQTKRSITELLSEQHSKEGACEATGPLRFKDSIMFWLSTSDWNALSHRLDARVDDMVERGLEKELVDFYNEHYEEHQHRIRDGNNGGEDDFHKGVFQSIGLKEFAPFLMLSPQEQQEGKGRELFQKGIDRLKLVTRQYARRQVKYVRNRLLKYSDREVPPIFEFDVADKSKWIENVRQPAFDIVDTYLAHNNPSFDQFEPYIRRVISKEESQKHRTLNKNSVSKCKYCNVYVSSELQWQDHIKSKGHKYVRSKYLRQRDMSTDVALDNNGRLNVTHGNIIDDE